MKVTEILEEISRRIDGLETDNDKEDYFILERPKHKRVICFCNNIKGLKFIKQKFRHSWYKRLVYVLIRLGFHKLFCKKISLSSKLGDVIYIANSVKSFDLDNECVYVFEKNMDELLKNVKIQNYLAMNNLAPKLLGISTRNYYAEELLYSNNNLTTKEIFTKLNEFYTLTNHNYIHGDFVRDHVRVDTKGNIKFIDWNMRIGNKEEDFNSYLRSLKQ